MREPTPLERIIEKFGLQKTDIYFADTFARDKKVYKFPRHTYHLMEVDFSGKDLPHNTFLIWHKPKPGVVLSGILSFEFLMFTDKNVLRLALRKHLFYS